MVCKDLGLVIKGIFVYATTIQKLILIKICFSFLKNLYVVSFRSFISIYLTLI
jgi:hypothetical protein